MNKIFWIVNKKNPLKNKAYFSLEKRMYLAKKITKNFKNIKVIYFDKMVKSSRSIDIINFLVKKKKFINIHFIIGSDILMELHRWKSWKKLLKLTKLVVFSRKGYDKKSRYSLVAKYLKNKNIIYINNKPIKISSTILRKKFKKSL